ncbi:MAG TPA: endonuclease MutS2, partial [bacterium]|nr:endonuclease MutS2 [bacterium]
MDNDVFETLEFDKVIEHLSQLPISRLGQKLIQQLQSHTDASFIERRLSEVTELKAILDYDDPFPLAGLQDISTEISKVRIGGTFLSTEELIKVAQTLEVARKIKSYFRERMEKYPVLSNIIKRILTFQPIEAEIERCIDRSNYELFDHASPDLKRIRRSIQNNEEQIRRKLDAMLSTFSSKGYLQENLIAVRNNRLVLMVRDEHRRKVRGIIHDQSATGATLFIEPLDTLELNNKIRALNIEEQREIERILLLLSDRIRSQLSEIIETVDELAEIDFVYAKAQFSRQIMGEQPAINSDHRLEIIKGKHPLLALRYGASREVVPLDVTLGESFHTLVISGPNAGGKTVALKTIGLLSLMACCGMHIPADPSSSIAVFEKIFAAIGDRQSLENDLSTFSSHVAALKAITDSVNNRSLVLIDEIGSGTDPEEGAALAVAVLEKLTSIGCLTVVSTHQGAIKVFAHETSGIENGSMEFDRETLQPTYRFRIGIPGSSYAYEIASRLGISND